MYKKNIKKEVKFQFALEKDLHAAALLWAGEEHESLSNLIRRFLYEKTKKFLKRKAEG